MADSIVTIIEQETLIINDVGVQGKSGNSIPIPATPGLLKVNADGDLESAVVGVDFLAPDSEGTGSPVTVREDGSGALTAYSSTSDSTVSILSIKQEPDGSHELYAGGLQSPTVHAMVVPRTGALSDLMALTIGNNELCVSTDVPGLVVLHPLAPFLVGSLKSFVELATLTIPPGVGPLSGNEDFNFGFAPSTVILCARIAVSGVTAINPSWGFSFCRSDTYASFSDYTSDGARLIEMDRSGITLPAPNGEDVLIIKPPLFDVGATVSLRIPYELERYESGDGYSVSLMLLVMQ